MEDPSDHNDGQDDGCFDDCEIPGLVPSDDETDDVDVKKDDGRETPEVVKSGKGKRGKGKKEDPTHLILEKRRRGDPPEGDRSPVYPTRSPHPPTTPKIPQGTRCRPKVYLLDHLSSHMYVSKLPKTQNILSVFMYYLQQGNDQKAAAQMTTEKLKISWAHHFGIRVIYGKDFEEEMSEDETKKIICQDRHITAKIINLHKEYKLIEHSNRRPDRAHTTAHLEKVQKFVEEKLEMPFDISRKIFEEIFKEKSGIKDWREDVEHLTKQLEKNQESSVDSWDQRQKNRDQRKLTDKLNAEETARKLAQEEEESKQALEDWNKQTDNNNLEERIDLNDKDFEVVEVKTSE